MPTVAARPAPYPFEPQHTALVLIDMQRDFLEPGGFGETLGNDVSLLTAIVPTVKAVLPDPQSLAASYTGNTCIGDIVKGTKDGKPRELFIYQVSDHAEAYAEVESQGISYTAGVPPVAAAAPRARR